MNKKAIVIGASAVGIILIFTLSYLYTKASLDKKSKENLTSIAFNAQELSDKTMIILKAQDKESNALTEYKAITFKEFKETYDYKVEEGKGSKPALVEYLKVKGYTLERESQEELAFIKMHAKGYVVDKYYLGATEEGYICILKAKNTEELIVENPSEDISSRKLDMLQEYEKNWIKNNTEAYDTREEALDALSEYDS